MYNVYGCIWYFDGSEMRMKQNENDWEKERRSEEGVWECVWLDECLCECGQRNFFVS